MANRVNPQELSRKYKNDNTVLTQYKAGCGEIIIKSVFKDNETLEDLFFQIIQSKLRTHNQ